MLKIPMLKFEKIPTPKVWKISYALSLKLKEHFYTYVLSLKSILQIKFAFKQLKLEIQLELSCNLRYILPSDQIGRQVCE